MIGLHKIRITKLYSNVNLDQNINSINIFYKLFFKLK